MGTVIGLGAGTSSGSGGSKAILVKQVQAGDSFPTTRQDGTPLVLGDWVTPKGTLPFTIGTVTFSTYKDTASWTGVEWLLNANPFQKTSETPVNNKAAESVSGTANYQNQINIENKAKFGTKLDKLETPDTRAYVHSGATQTEIRVNTNPLAGNIPRYNSPNATLRTNTPIENNDCANKAYADTKTEQVSTLATPTTAMIGKAPVQYIGATDETATPKLYHGYYYEVVADGAGGAKWENINVSRGVMPYLNGVLLDGDNNTEQVRVSFKGTRAEWNALPMSQRKCRFAIITDEDSIPQLHIALVVNDTTGKLKAQLWDTTDTVKVAESSEVLVKDNESLHTGAFVTTIPAGQTGAGKHGITFTKADGTTINLVLEDSADKLITALDTVVLKNKTISADDNTVSDLETDNFKGGVVSTEISPAASASDTKLPTEKAARTELDKKQDILVPSDNITIGTDGKTIKSNQIDDTLSTSTTKTWSIDAIKEGIRVMGATFRGTFATKAALDAYSGVKENNDRAVVTADETQGNKTTMYIFDGTSWIFEYVISDKPLEFDDSTIHINASGKVEVKDDGITPAKMKKQDVSKEGFGLTVKNDGTIDYERIRQYKAVTTFASETGNTETLYHLTTPCIIGTKSYSIGLYTWGSSTGFSLVADAGGGSGSSPIIVGIVSPGGFMPTVRPDGSALVIGDFVKPYASATFPFTVSGVTFNSKNDSAVYMTGGNWLVNATVYQKTSDTPVNDRTTESIDGAAGTAVYQAEINAENATAINAAAKTATFEKTSDRKIHLNIKDRKNNDIVEQNIEKVVFEDDEQTVKNKTLEAKDNKIDPIIDAASLPSSGAKKALYRRTSDNTLWYSRDGGTTWKEVGKEQVFIAVYDLDDPTQSTPYAKVKAAFDAGMMIQVKRGFHYYPLQYFEFEEFTFIGTDAEDRTRGRILVCNSSVWTDEEIFNLAFPSNNSDAEAGDILCKTADGTQWRKYIQRTALPTASAAELGNIYQYMGADVTTEPVRKHGHFYECKVNAGVYGWEEIGTEVFKDVADFSTDASLEGVIQRKGISTIIGRYGLSSFAISQGWAITENGLEHPTEGTYDYDYIEAHFDTLIIIQSKADGDMVRYIHIADGTTKCAYFPTFAGEFWYVCKYCKGGNLHDLGLSDAVSHVSTLPTYNIKDNVLYCLVKPYTILKRYELTTAGSNIFLITERGLVNKNTPTAVVYTYEAIEEKFREYGTFGYLQESSTGQVIRYINENQVTGCQYSGVALPNDYIYQSHYDGAWHKVNDRGYLDRYLPLSGGTMTGPISFNTSKVISRNATNATLQIDGSTSDTCGSMILYGTNALSAYDSGNAELRTMYNGSSMSLKASVRRRAVTFNNDYLAQTSLGSDYYGNVTGYCNTNARFFILNAAGNLVAIWVKTVVDGEGTVVVVNGNEVACGTDFTIGDITMMIKYEVEPSSVNMDVGTLTVNYSPSTTQMALLRMF